MSIISRDKLGERADSVLDYTVGYVHNDDKEYFRPQREDGVPDFELMLDVIGFSVGAIYEKRSEALGDTRGIITERIDGTVKNIGEVTVERGGFRYTRLYARNGEVSWSSMKDSVIRPELQDTSASTIKWWEAYLDGRLEVVGHIGDVGGGWPVRE